MVGLLKLRGKILLSLIGLSVVPLAAVVLVVLQLTGDQLEREMEERAAGVADFVEISTTLSQREYGNYIQLMSRNAEVVNTVYYATLSGEIEGLQTIAEEAQKLYGFDLVEILGADGTLIFRSVTAEGIPAVTGKEHSVIQDSLEGESSYALGTFDGQLGVVAASPVATQQEVIGHLVGVTFLDKRFARKLKALSHSEVAFFDEKGVYATTHEGLQGLDLTLLQSSARELEELGRGVVSSRQIRRMTIEGDPFALIANSLGSGHAGVLLAIDISEMVSSQEKTRQLLWLLLLVLGTVAGLIGVVISRGITRPLAEVVANLKNIAEGEGDLTQILQVSSRDEVGALAESFNAFVARLREMVQRTRAVSSDLVGATEKIRASSNEVNAGAIRQSQALEESFRAIQGIDSAVSGIAESTGVLVHAVEESSSATLELGATIEEIASQMEKLFGTVDEVSSSISEMSVASQQVAENVEILSSSTEVTASSIIELDASIKEIEENAERTNRLSEEAARDAEEGKAAVEESIRGIGEVRQTVDRANEAIKVLGKQSDAIGKILNVIDEVADQTGLLALNAAIIAAQAGEHGRGFAVVAVEIRQLADRTAVSTREIGTIIGGLQAGTREAVDAMTAGSERVNREVERSKVAGAALEKIRNSTLKASEQVQGIVRATQEQSRGSRQITDSINQVASMLGQIATAVKQQTEGSRQLARAAEAMKEIASQGKISTREQAKGSHQIGASMEQVRNMIERIDAATREQTQRSAQVVEAVASIRAIAEGNAARTAELDQVMAILSRQTAALEDEVGAFKV
jgi:methyl-accepting chemotaxis protein